MIKVCPDGDCASLNSYTNDGKGHVALACKLNAVSSVQHNGEIGPKGINGRNTTGDHTSHSQRVRIDSRVEVVALRVQARGHAIRTLRAVATVHRGARVMFVAHHATTSTTADDGGEAFSVLLVEEGVQHGIDAAVGGAQPLGDGRRRHEHLLLEGARFYRSAQFDAREDAVQR